MTSKKLSKLQILTKSATKTVVKDLSPISPELKQTISKYDKDELVIERKTQHEHTLHRPDMVIGSTRRIKSSGRIWVKSGNRLVCKETVYSEGLLRLFMEALCNTVDNVWRSKQFKVPVKMIKITIDKQQGIFSVWNDGKPIPLDKFKEKNGAVTNEYIPEVIFGQLLTSSNYDDTEKRKTSGRNGIGAKACNIFSESFSVELYNPSHKAIYRQSWSNNMFTKNPPVFDRKQSNFPTDSGKFGYTLITWKPDYKRFEMTNLDDEFMSVAEKCIYDYALIARLNGVTTFYNEKEVEIADLKSYVHLYYETPPSEILQLKSSNCTVIIAPKADPLYKGDLMQVSFMNGILTGEGGLHVDDWEEAIFRPIIQKINNVKPLTEEKKKKASVNAKKKPSRPMIDITHIRKYFSIFIVAEADNPTFVGQNKNKFTGPPIAVNVKKSDIDKLMGWEFIERIEESIRFKELSVLKDVGKKKRNYVHVEGLEDANYAGDKTRAQECIFCLTEGSSAASYVVSGMKYGIEGKIGHDFIGLYELRGKLLNLRKASIMAIMKNKEVTSIIKAVGLEYGLDYSLLENRNKLRYGKIYAVADGDYDGFHITGLLINFLHVLFPTLLEVNDFFHFLRIPIIKINSREHKLSFLFQYEAQKFLSQNQVAKKTIRYYKGLGTSLKQDIKEDFGRYPVSLIIDDNGSDLLRKVFSKEEEDIDWRKDWLINYSPSDKSRTTPDYEVEELSISSFLNEEMIQYSLDSCKRAIANILDGLKESHRKVLSAAFKKKLTFKRAPLKVAQFANYVAESMNYHHGEQNLYDTIVKMAQRFVGTNNIPLFTDDGQFGSRRGGGTSLSPGKDAAQARYLFTRLEMLTRLIYRVEDDPYLPDKIDEGYVVEKEYYLPIIPMILVNGSAGIGTGSSSSIPQYNVLDLIDWIKVWLDKDGKITECLDKLIFYDTPDLVPFYRGFTGKIEVNDKKIITYGKLESLGKNTFRITELPLGRNNTSIQKFKKRLEKMRENKIIKTIKNNSKDENIADFLITIEEGEEDPTIESLKLVDGLTMTNMVLFDKEDKLHKFETVEDILVYYCDKRLDLYKIRKEGHLNSLTQDLKWVQNKIRFINMIDKNELVILDRNEDELEQELVDNNFNKKPTSKKMKTEEVVDDEENEDENEIVITTKQTFDYLLDMKARSLNIQSKVYKMLLKEEELLQTQIDIIKSTSVKNLWLNELAELQVAYLKWLKIADTGDCSSEKNKKNPVLKSKK